MSTIQQLQCAARDLQDGITELAQALVGTSPITAMRLHEIAMLQQAVADQLADLLPLPDLPQPVCDGMATVHVRVMERLMGGIR